MTDEKAKQILAQGNKYLQEAKSVINDLKFRSSKAPDDKKEVIDDWVSSIENLYNYALVQEIRVEERDVELNRRYLELGDCRLKLKELWHRYKLNEKIQEKGIDVMVEEFRDRASKILEESK